MAESHREDVAGRGAAVTELQGLAVDAKMLLALLQMQRCCWHGCRCKDAAVTELQCIAAVETMHQA